MNVKAKWILVAFAVGLLAGAGAVLYFGYRPASTTIADLRAESERLSRQYRDELDSYTRLLSTARTRVTELTEDLRRADAAYRDAIDGAERLENQIRGLQELVGEIQESSGRAAEYNRAIRNEADTALGDVHRLRGILVKYRPSSGERDPPAED